MLDWDEALHLLKRRILGGNRYGRRVEIDVQIRAWSGAAIEDRGRQWVEFNYREGLWWSRDDGRFGVGA